MKQFIAGVAVGVGCALMLISVAWAASQADYKALDLFSDAVERVNANYIEQISVPDLIERAVAGMLSSLDPHSSFIDAKQMADMQTATAGKFAGIGIELTIVYGHTKVIAPIDGAPAAIGGIRPGDIILKIDDQLIDGLPLSKVIEILHGPADSKVTLTIHRDGEAAPLNFVLQRAVVTISSVKSERIGDIGYIRISAFNEKTDDQLKNAVSALQQQIGLGLKGYIVDLRNDPGGLLQQAIAVSDEFLDSGTIVSLRGRNSEDNKTYSATSGDIAAGKPIVVLVNAGTASGSEILAGALQDNHRATIIGMKTFGNGTIQTIIPLPGGAALRLTTAKFYKPLGSEIQVDGITPDIAVAQNAKGVSDTTPMPIRSEADLLGHFPAESQSSQSSAPIIYPDKKYNDFELTYALNRLNGN